MEGTPRAKRRGEEAVYAGFALLLTERRAVVSSRGASVRLWGRVDSPRQDRKALRKPGFPFRKVGSRRFGLEPRKHRSRLCGMGFPTGPPGYRMDPNLLSVLCFTNGKVGIEQTRRTDQSLDFGRVGESYSRVMFDAGFPTDETPSHAIGAGE